MKVELLQIGKTNFGFLTEGLSMYQDRIQRYIPFNISTIPDIKNRKKYTEVQIKDEESKEILSRLQPGDFLILLDENGKGFTSEEFSVFLDKQFQYSHKRIVFLIGGAYGVSQEIIEKAGFRMALSRLTFSHQLVRLVFLEQLYRALTILRNEPYHHR